MRKKSKLAMALAGMGLLGLLTGCGEDEAQIVPITPVESVAPEGGSEAITNPSGSAAESSTPATQDKTDLFKPIDETAVPDTELPLIQNGNAVAPAPGTNNSTNASGSNSNSSASEAEGTELIALADTEEQAKQIAEQYGIRLKSYAAGVAVYTTTKDPQTVIQMGIDKGYPLLSLNHTHTYFN